MARNTPTQDPSPPADVRLQQWDDADGVHAEHDEAAGRRARRLLSRSNSRFYRLGDRFGSMRRRLAGERWFWRIAIVIASLLVIFAGCFGALWWRLGAGPINLDMATPWLAAAIEENIGNGNTVEVGGTQIERAGRISIAVRIRDIIVRDRDHAIVASAPKAEVRLSGYALLMGRLRAESLNLVDAELAVRITPGRLCHRIHRRQCATARHRRRLEKGSRASANFSAPGCAESDRRRLRPDPAGRFYPGRQRASRIAGRPRLARQPEPDRVLTGKTSTKSV